MRSSIKIAAIAATAVLAISGLSACSSGSSSSEPTPAGSASMVGGMTECTEAVVYAAADEAAKAMGADNVFTPDSLQCADGWAVVTGILGTGSTEMDAPQGAPTSMIFEAEGQFWIPKAAADVCGTTDGSAYPADAMIPEALFTAGCSADAALKGVDAALM
jgi:hypothetical protein